MFDGILNAPLKLAIFHLTIVPEENLFLYVKFLCPLLYWSDWHSYAVNQSDCWENIIYWLTYFMQLVSF